MEIILYANNGDADALIARCHALGVNQVCLTLDSLPGYAETGVPEREALRALVQRLAKAGIGVPAGNGATGRSPGVLLDPVAHRREIDAQLQTLESLGAAG